MLLKNKRVLVTGAGGFIGSHLLEALINKSAKVRAFVRYNSKTSCGNIALLDKRIKSAIDLCYGDLRELDSLAKVMSNVDIVFNLAALVGIPYSYLHPHEVVMTNVIGALNVLTAARNSKVERVIQTSTSEVYGSPQRVPIKETAPLRPQSPYSASKISSDAIALSFFYSFGLPVSVIRPFNAYGPRQSARAVIPTIIAQALAGNTIKLGSVTTRRDFTYVKDITEGFIRIAESNHSIGEVINIGSGRNISIHEVVKLIGQILGKKLIILEDAQRVRPAKSEVIRLKASNFKAKRLLNWSPRFTLEHGLKLTIDFIATNSDLYNPLEYIV